MGKKKEAAAAGSLSSAVLDSSPAGGISKKKSKKATNQKMQKEAELFINDVLPNLRKEMVRKKKVNFDLKEYATYLKPDSGFVPTFCLPLFHFMGKNEILCTRYGLYDGKHSVKTTAGHDRVMWVSKNIKQDQLSEEMMTYMNRRFSPEWYKIPSSYGLRAKAAANNGHEGKFRVILVNVYFDSFINKEGEKVETINPVLAFEPVTPPVVKASSSSSKTKTSKEQKQQQTESESAAAAVPEEILVIPFSPSSGIIGAQVMPLELLPEPASSDSEED